MDRYIIGDMIGEGAFGEVYIAKDKHNDCVDALKKFKGAPGSAIKELEALMKVKHSGIIGCKGLIHDDGRVWLQTEYCQGGNLDKFWKKRKPDLSIKYQFMKEISGTIHHLHKNGITHRDLKPENILIALDKEDTPHTKICDFGLAKIHDMPSQYMKTQVGTQLFVAPEVVKGKYTNKADIFSMGIIFRAMVFDRFVEIKGGRFLGECHYAEGKHPIPWGEAFVNEPDLKVTTSPKELPSYRARSILDAMLIADFHARPTAEDVAQIIATLSDHTFYVETSEKVSPTVRRAQSLPSTDDAGSSAAAAGIRDLHLSDDGTSPGEYYQQLTESMRHIHNGLRAQSSTPRSQTRVTTPTRRTDAHLSRTDKFKIVDESPTDSPDEEPALNSSQLMQTKQLVNLWENAFTKNTSEWQRSQVERTAGRLTQSLDKIGRGKSLNDDEMESFDSAWASMDELMQGEEHDSLFD